MIRCNSIGHVPSLTCSRLVVEELVMVNCAFEISGKMIKDKMVIFFIAEIFF
jgi:hypothetical protein